MGRTKGNVAEREVAKLIKPWWSAIEPDSLFIRTPLSGGWSDDETRSEFKATGDLMTTSPTFPFDVEVKRRENWDEGTFFAGLPSPVWGWWKQAQRSAMLTFGRERRYPMLWLRQNRRPWLVVLAQSHVEMLFRGYRVDSLPSSLCSQCLQPRAACGCRVARPGSGTLGAPLHRWGPELNAVHFGAQWPVCFAADALLAVHPSRFCFGSDAAPERCPDQCPKCAALLRRVRGRHPLFRRCHECSWEWDEAHVRAAW
jgi:hypothetical protein